MPFKSMSVPKKDSRAAFSDICVPAAKPIPSKKGVTREGGEVLVERR